MKSMGICEAKTHFTALCEDVARTGQPALVSKRGKPLVCVVPAPAEESTMREDILAAWRQWESARPANGDEPDFPDVARMRGELKSNPLGEA